MVTITMLEESSPVVHNKPPLGDPAPREEEKAPLYGETRSPCMSIVLCQGNPRGYGNEDSLSMNVDEEDAKGKEIVSYEGKGNEGGQRGIQHRRLLFCRTAGLTKYLHEQVANRKDGTIPDKKKFRSKHELLYFLEHNRRMPRNQRMLENPQHDV
ncbi:hypothetical protein AKJ16_DCAP19866 [Drosera capensis]